MVALDWYPRVEEALIARDAPIYQLRALSRLVRLPCLANNRVRLLIDGEALFAALPARVSCSCCSASSSDEVLGRLQELLLQCAAA